MIMPRGEQLLLPASPWFIGLSLFLALANVLGSVLGSWLALRHGTGFVRVIFIVVVGGLIVKTGMDAI